MNILIFSWRGSGHPHAGGAEQSSHEHAVGWSKAGHKVTLFTSSFDGAKGEEEVDGIHIIRRGGQIFQVHVYAMFWYLFSPHPRFDIVVDEVHGIPFFTPLYVKEKKLAFIHEVTKEVWSLNPWSWPLNLMPKVLGPIFEPLIFKFFYRNISFMTVSESTQKDLALWGIPKENITVIHNGFKKISNSKQIGKEKIKTVIYLGALSKDKGIEDALECFEILLHLDENWQFWIVGKGEKHQLEHLEDRVKSLGIENKIFVFGFVSEKEKYDLLSRAHVLINPSIREGWGLVVIEAASVGTPTVAYDVAGLRDSVKDYKTGLLSQPDPPHLAEKIEQVFKDKKLYHILQKNCLDWSKKFSWGKASRESLNLLASLTKKAS